MRLIKKFPFSAVHSLLEYPTPSNINYFWNFGSFAGIALIVQIITGIFLAMHYTPHVDYAFASVEHIMRDVNYGWLLRYIHANGASMFLLVVYLHVFRGLYYGSYNPPREIVWFIGVIILLLTILTAFMGYVLPWGQMSFWGVTVITNMVSAVPIVGQDIVIWLWGGYSVDNATLNRFFSLHYLVPFILIALSGVHVIILHDHLANNPLGIDSKMDRIPFHPYLTIKDLFAFMPALMIFVYFVFFNPNILGHADNYIPANPMVTPPHIVPEWYFLPFYAILRAIPHKLGGVIAMVGAILIIAILPFVNTSQIQSSTFRPLYKKFFWLFVFTSFLLGWVGGNAPDAPYTYVGVVGTIYYFSYFVIIVPIVGYIENALYQTKISKKS